MKKQVMIAAMLVGSVMTAAPVLAADDTVTVLCGEDAKITGEENNEMFGGDAVSGVQKLIADGAVSVNGVAVNSGDVSVNGALALWKNEDNTWSWNAHGFVAHEENIDYDEACLHFVEGMSGLAGLSYTVTLEDGQATAVDFLVQDVCIATDVTTEGDSTKVSVYGAGDGSMNRTDPSTIEFANDMVEPDSEGNLPEGECGIIYWLDQEGWHLKRCDSQVAEATADYEWSGTQINLEYSQPWNRPSQPLAAISMLGVDSVEMTEWFINGLTCGWSYTDARSMLPEAIEKAEAALAEIPVSEDGTDIAEGEPWVTQEYYDAFSALVEETKEIEATDGLETMDYDAAFYNLSIAYGGDGTFHAVSGNIYPDGIGFVTFAYSHNADETEK